MIIRTELEEVFYRESERERKTLHNHHERRRPARKLHADAAAGAGELPEPQQVGAVSFEASR